MHSLFLQYPNGFDNFGRWRDHHVEMHKRHPLECAEFGGEWLELWTSPAKVQFRGDDRKWQNSMIPMPSTVGGCIVDISERCDQPQRYWGFEKARVMLHDGTVIREWSAQ